MKKLFLLITVISMINSLAISQTAVGIGTASPNNSSALDIQSTSKGVLIPRMSTAQRNAISSPATGLLVFDNNTGSFWFRNTSGWIELVDTLNSAWKKNGDDIYSANTGNVGLGIAAPVQKLAVNGNLGLYNSGNFVGAISHTGNDLLINAKLGNLINLTSAQHLVLQYENSGTTSSGNVGIGAAAPDAKLQIEGGSNASPAGGGFLQLGPSASTNIGIDQNEIQARNNGAAGKLFVQAGGGDFQVGGTNNIIIKDGYQLYRNRPLSTDADLLPIAYGKINGGGAQVLSGTGNIFIQRLGTGEYRLLLLGETNIYANRNQYTILLTPDAYGSSGYTLSYNFMSDNSIRVYAGKPTIHFTNEQCVSGCTTSYIEDIGLTQAVDAAFSIVVYKM